jgi:hypothetical protein
MDVYEAYTPLSMTGATLTVLDVAAPAKVGLTATRKH